ncbi:MAG: helix-hairpin-helix domain-containing protein [Saprospiraceae bacterium]
MIKKQYSKTAPVCNVTFTLTTEQVGKNAEVRVLGTFNDWSWDKGLVLASKKKAYEGNIELAAGQVYEFRYVVNGHNWFNDESADDYQPTPFFSHNCVLALEAVTIEKAAPKAKAAAPKVEKKAAAPKAEKKAAAPKAEKPAAAPKAKVAKTTAPKADDLKKIEGIGPKIADLLKADGIVTFADLAKAKTTQLQAVLDAAGPRYKMHDPATWAEQAKLAAAGKWDELTALQDKLNGGKR